MRVVVADTSPINYLILTDNIELLPQLFRSVIIPPEVLRELTGVGSPPAVQAWARKRPHWLQVKPAPGTQEPGLDGLDPGERAAILFALQEAEVLLLIDEAAGRAVTSKLGIPTTGTLGVLRAAARENMIDLKIALGRLQSTNFRITQSLIDDLMQASDTKSK